MARVQYGQGVNAFAGSIRGTTFQRTRSGQIARGREGPHRSTTPKQSIIHAITYDLTRRWRELELSEQEQWNTFAEAHPRINRYGQVKHLNGYNYFILVNSNRIRAEQEIVKIPQGDQLPTPVQNATITLTIDQIQIDFELSGPPNDNTIIVYTTPPMIGTTTSFAPTTRETLITPADTTTPIDITTNWSEVHGLNWPPSLSTNLKVGMTIYTIHNQTGLNSVAVQTLAQLQN